MRRVDAPLPPAGGGTIPGAPVQPSELATTGCFAAVAAAAVAAAVLTLAPILFFFSLPVAAVHAVLLGLPLYMFLSRRRRITLGLSIACGLLIGAVPALILAFLFFPPSAADAGALLGGAESGPVLWAQLERWAQRLTPPATLGASGGLGGAVFWLVAEKGREE